MIEKTYTYKDFNGNERTETFMFDLSAPELMEMEMSEAGGLQAKIQKIISTQDTTKILPIFKEVILKAYGEKSADGRRFIKSEQMAEEFSQTPAYSMLYLELLSDEGKAAEFFNGIVPKDAVEAATKTKQFPTPQDHKR